MRLENKDELAPENLKLDADWRDQLREKYGHLADNDEVTEDESDE